MVKARKYVVKKYFQGDPKRDDYEIVEQELPALQRGEILVKNEYISVDPSLRLINGMKLKCVPYDQSGFSVGIVIESKDSNFPVGTRVVSYKGWCDYYVGNAGAKFEDPTENIYKLPDLKGLPISLGVGAVGMPGASAYFAFLETCKPKAGETVVVTGAAGAVGSLVGQIAKIKGCRVIGFAGSDDKVDWLEKELGFDKAFNYKKVDVAQSLKEAAPKGIDCYLDNVGGEISSTIMSQMNMHGRVSVCGSMSAYNELGKLPKATILQPFIVSKQLYIEGFINTYWYDQWGKAFEDIVGWIKSGQIKAREHVTVGFDNIFEAFTGMLAGKNFGKAVVKV